MRHFFLAVPGGSICSEALWGLMHASVDMVALGRGKASNAMLAFNKLWCEFVNGIEEHKFTHWVMHHNDMEAEPLWADGLAEIQEKHDADIVSCAARIKDDRNLTSTAILQKSTGKIRRLTVTEVDRLPQEVFTVEDINATGILGDVLLVNTGLWIAPANRGWLRKIWFQQHDRIRECDDGKLMATSLTEDWDISIRAYEMGLKVLGTNALKPRHHGSKVYEMTDSGTFTEDPGD